MPKTLLESEKDRIEIWIAISNDISRAIDWMAFDCVKDTMAWADEYERTGTPTLAGIDSIVSQASQATAQKQAATLLMRTDIDQLEQLPELFRMRASEENDAAAKVAKLPLACERHLRAARTWLENADGIEKMLAAAAIPLRERFPDSLNVGGRAFQDLLEKLRAAYR